MNSREKGARFEREIANRLKEYGYDTRRGQQYCGVNGDADVVGLPGVHLECKHVEKLNIHDAMQQSIVDAREGELPVVIFKKNRKRTLVALTFEDFMELYEEAKGK